MEGRGYSLVGSVDMCSVQGANQRSPDCESRRVFVGRAGKSRFGLCDDWELRSIFGRWVQWILGSLGRLEARAARIYRAYEDGETSGDWHGEQGHARHVVCWMLYTITMNGDRNWGKVQEELR
jgi:hypothetical protein